MNKAQIIAEIQRTAKANDGIVLGWRRFEEETGIKYYDWYGQYWVRWGDAVREAGLEPNRMSEAYGSELLLEKLIVLTRNLGRVPVQGDLLLAAKSDTTFPSEKAFRRLGPKRQRAALVITHCETHPGNEDVAKLWEPHVSEAVSLNVPSDDGTVLSGFVYLLKHGTRREYKIGFTHNPLRREGEVRVELPESLQPIHYIETDDPSGVESYWHRRFADKRLKNEWFALTADDVRAFKRWKRIY